jgi:hypothetical protein
MERARPSGAWSLRAARSGAVAAAAVGTSLGGHVLAGGAAPGVVPLAAFTLAVAALTTVLARTRWTPLRLLGALAVAQGGLHLAFDHLAPSTGAPVSGVGMLVWHLVATAVAGALVLRAEAWLWRVFAGLDVGDLLSTEFTAARAISPASDADRACRPFGYERTYSRRGPPARAVV